MSYTIAMARPPRTYDGRTTSGNPIFVGDVARFVGGRGGAARRLRNAEIPQQLREPLAILCQVDRVRRGPDDPDAGLLQRQRELQRRLPAVLDDARDFAAGLLLARDDRRHVLERQRLEVQPIDRVVVGRHRLGVAVDHDGLEPLFAQAQRPRGSSSNRTRSPGRSGSGRCQGSRPSASASGPPRTPARRCRTGTA